MFHVGYLAKIVLLKYTESAQFKAKANKIWRICKNDLTVKGLRNSSRAPSTYNYFQIATIYDIKFFITMV